MGAPQIFANSERVGITGVSYTLIAHFGISGITYDPLQFTFELELWRLLTEVLKSMNSSVQ